MTENHQFSWQRLIQQSEGLPERFSEADEAGLEALAQVYLSSIE